MGTILDFFGGISALLTTTPIGKLLTSLDSTIHVRHLVILSVLPWTTLTELAGIQIGSWVIPTYTWPKMLSKLVSRTFLASEELVSEVSDLTELLLT